MCCSGFYMCCSGVSLSSAATWTQGLVFQTWKNNVFKPIINVTSLLLQSLHTYWKKKPLTYFLLFIHLPTAPVIIFMPMDVAKIQDLTRQFCCCHRSWNLSDEIRQLLRNVISIPFRRQKKKNYWISVYLDSLRCYVTLFFQVHCTDEISSRFCSLNYFIWLSTCRD